MFGNLELLQKLSNLQLSRYTYIHIYIYIYPQWQFSFGEERLKLFSCWNKFRHGKLIRFDLMALIVWVG